MANDPWAEFRTGPAPQQAPAADPIIKRAPPPKQPSVPTGYDIGPDGVAKPVPGIPATALPGYREPKTTYRTMTAEDLKQYPSLDPKGVYQINSEGKIEVLQKPPEGDKSQGYSQAALDAFDRALNSIKELRDHPGRSAAVGSGFDPAALGSYKPWNSEVVAGTNAAGYEARLDSLKSQTFLPMVAALKGMGALSNAEGDKLTASIGALDTKMPEEDFMKSLRQIETDLQRYKERGSGENLDRNDAIRKEYQSRLQKGENPTQIVSWLKSQGLDVDPNQIKAAVLFRRNNPDVDVSRYLLTIDTTPAQGLQPAPAAQPAPGSSDIDAILSKYGVGQ